MNAWSAKAIVGFMLSLTIGLFPFFGILAAIAAIVLGAVARKNVRDAHGALRGGGLALAALIIGIIEVVVMMTFPPATGHMVMRLEVDDRRSVVPTRSEARCRLRSAA